MTAESYDAVRAALDVSLDSETLPAVVIASTIYADAAAAEIKVRDPAWETRTDDALAHLERAHILITAALIAPAIPSITGESFNESRYTRQAIDWEKRAADLRQRASEELAAILTPADTSPGRPTFFSVASGRRGR